MTSAAPLYFFLHVPKCAGNTLIGHFAEQIGPRSVAAPWSPSVGRNFRNNLVGSRGLSGDVDPLVLHGHALSASQKQWFPGRPIREAVLLRDPVGYFVSMYNFRLWRHRTGQGPPLPPFAAWYWAERRNPMTRFLLHRYFEQGVPGLYRLSSREKIRWLENRLRDFWFVGCYTRVDELANRVADELGVSGGPKPRNVDKVRAVRVSDLPRWLINEITEENAADGLLYRRWRNRGFDLSLNPSPLTGELPAADQFGLLIQETICGMRKARLRRGLHGAGLRNPANAGGRSIPRTG
ncbi:MAG: hypothetical protein AAGJ28_14790 [Pseudomonadota bacterium]